MGLGDRRGNEERNRLLRRTKKRKKQENAGEKHLMKELVEAVRKITEKRREESEQKITLAAGMNRMNDDDD